MTNYVAGFAFSDRDPRNILMVRKEQPSWQKGKLNAIGGKVQPLESVAHAMIREFYEETGINTTENQWDRISILRSGEHDIHFFRAQLSHEDLAGRNDQFNDAGEKTFLIEWKHLLMGQYSLGFDYIPNLSWLLPLAAYRHDTYHPLYAVETYRG